MYNLWILHRPCIKLYSARSHRQVGTGTQTELCSGILTIIDLQSNNGVVTKLTE
jgi:hypothetical protein